MEKYAVWKINLSYIEEDRLLKINKNIKSIKMEAKHKESNENMMLRGFVELYEQKDILWMKKYVHPLASFEPVALINDSYHTQNIIIDIISIIVYTISNYVIEYR